MPIPSGTTPFQPTPVGTEDAAIIKLNSTATAVLDATFLGGSGAQSVTGLAADTSGVYITGTTTSNDFPAKNPLQGTLGTSGNNGFVTKLDPSLSTAVYSTYLGLNSAVGSPVGQHHLAVDSAEDAYITTAATAGFPTNPSALQPTCSAGTLNACAVVAELNPTGSALLLSTYLSSTSSAGVAIAVDSAKNIYVGGQTDASLPQVHSL